jgi:hypothetical protein
LPIALRDLGFAVVVTVALRLKQNPPVDNQTGGHQFYFLPTAPAYCLLLFVINRNAFEPLALGIGSACSDGAHFPIRRHY